MQTKEWILIGELMDVTRDWNPFELPEKEEKKRVMRIGRELDELGGYDLMLYAYRTARAANKYSTDIQHYWDGIGTWRW